MNEETFVLDEEKFYCTKLRNKRGDSKTRSRAFFGWEIPVEIEKVRNKGYGWLPRDVDRERSFVRWSEGGKIPSNGWKKMIKREKSSWQRIREVLSRNHSTVVTRGHEHSSSSRFHENGLEHGTQDPRVRMHMQGVSNAPRPAPRCEIPC